VTVVPVQAGGELYNVLVRKTDGRPPRLMPGLSPWSTSLTTAGTTHSALAAAVDLASAHQLGMIMAVAAEKRCQLPLSEDLRDGFVRSGLVNPFAAPRTLLLGS
jgi:predicted nucleic acid-binding protein